MSEPLTGCPEGIDPEAWRGMLALGDRQHHVRGDVVFTDQSTGEALYIIVRGPIEILKSSRPGADLRLAIIEDGALFGERCLFGDGRRSAMARAYGNVELVAIPVGTLRNYLAQHPGFALEFYRHLCERFSQMVHDVDSDLRSLYQRLSFT